MMELKKPKNIVKDNIFLKQLRVKIIMCPELMDSGWTF